MFGSNPFGGFGSTSGQASPFGSQSSPFGAQMPTPTFGSLGFGQSMFGSQVGGTRLAPYTATLKPDDRVIQYEGNLESITAMSIYKDKSHEELRWQDYQCGDKGAQMPTFGSLGFGQSTLKPDDRVILSEGNLESISAMSIYKDKSHEELRWQDYQRGDKGGPNTVGQPGGINFQTSTHANPFGQTSAFGQAAANPFSSTTFSNPFAPKTPVFGSTALSGGFGSFKGNFNHDTFGHSPAVQANIVMQPTSIPNPFGTLPTMPQMSIGRAGSSAPSFRYGISSMPVPFFNDDEVTPTTPKADALLIPRENSSALIISPIEQWPSTNGVNIQSMLKNIFGHVEIIIFLVYFILCWLHLLALYVYFSKTIM